MKNQTKEPKNLTGYADQEILIDRLSIAISNFSKMHSGTIRMYVKDALNDALGKRNASFKDMKIRSKEERNNFVKDIVVFSIKRSTLIASFDDIYEACLAVYYEWKKEFRPD